MVLQYDASFDGFLSAVFYAYEYKINEVSIQKNSVATATFFDTIEKVPTETYKARRVWKGIEKNFSPQGKTALYKAFLSELPTIENTLFTVIKKGFSSSNYIDKDYTNPAVLKISKVAKMVAREKHRMDAFVRFKLTKDGIYFATIAPDFDVLPLNASHFKNRYADQKWIIYDVKRNYGIYYDLKEIHTVKIILDTKTYSVASDSLFFTTEELEFQELWKNYFKSTNIASRKNMRLHLQHVPKRYWKYLSEKQEI